MKISYTRNVTCSLFSTLRGESKRGYHSISRARKEEISLKTELWGNQKHNLWFFQQGFSNSSTSVESGSTIVEIGSNTQGSKLKRESTKKNQLRPTKILDRSTYHAINKLFSKPPLSTSNRMSGHVFRQAISQVKPCMDLRQVRRGRKVFQIPRVIPPANRELSGVRRLLSILVSTNRQGIQRAAKSVDSLSRDRREAIKSDSIYQLPKAKLAVTSLQKNFPSVTQLRKGSYTRTTLLGGHHEISAGLLAYSLGNEIKACSRSRSRAIENKKRIYKVASGNRGSIRMAWWL